MISGAKSQKEQMDCCGSYFQKAKKSPFPKKVQVKEPRRKMEKMGSSYLIVEIRYLIRDIIHFGFKLY